MTILIGRVLSVLVCLGADIADKFADNGDVRCRRLAQSDWPLVALHPPSSKRMVYSG
jgi:hypothetical protein